MGIRTKLDIEWFTNNVTWTWEIEKKWVTSPNGHQDIDTVAGVVLLHLEQSSEMASSHSPIGFVDELIEF